MSHRTHQVRSRRAVLISTALGLLGALAAGCRDRSGEAGHADRANGPQVTINGRTWRVELATTEFQRYQGLSGRRELPEGTGMLFAYRSAAVLDFCMRGCHIPIDIAFIGPDLRVVAVHTMAVEPDMAGRVAYSSGQPAQFAMEVPAGELARNGLTPGARVAFSEEAQAAAKAADSP